MTVVGDDDPGVPFVVYLITCFGLQRVRVSGGYLCEAEAPIKPAGETRQPLHFSWINHFIYKLFIDLKFIKE